MVFPPGGGEGGRGETTMFPPPSPRRGEPVVFPPEGGKTYVPPQGLGGETTWFSPLKGEKPVFLFPPPGGGRGETFVSPPLVRLSERENQYFITKSAVLVKKLKNDLKEFITKVLVFFFTRQPIW